MVNSIHLQGTTLAIAMEILVRLETENKSPDRDVRRLRVKEFLGEGAETTSDEICDLRNEAVHLGKLNGEDKLYTQPHQYGSDLCDFVAEIGAEYIKKGEDSIARVESPNKKKGDRTNHGNGGSSMKEKIKTPGTSYLSSSVKFIYIAYSVFLRHLLVFSIGKSVGNRCQAASFCSSLKSLRNISPFLSRVQAT